MFRKTSPPPEPGTFPVERLVIASEGRPIAWPVLQQAFGAAGARRPPAGLVAVERSRTDHESALMPVSC